MATCPTLETACCLPTSAGRFSSSRTLSPKPIALLHNKGIEVVLVSSGAMGFGLNVLELNPFIMQARNHKS